MMSDDLSAVMRCAHQSLLTTRELRLLEWLASGRTNVQIGRCAGRSEKTVRNQLTGLYAKLGAANRAEAVALWLRRGSGGCGWGRQRRLQIRDIRPIGRMKCRRYAART